MKKKIDIRDLIPIICFATILVIFLFTTQGTIVSAYNLRNLIDQAIPTLIGGMGVVFVAAMGSTDISVGANAALSATVGAFVASRLGFFWMIPVCIGISVCVGLLCGVLVAKFKMSSFMTTIAMLIGLKGLLYYFVSIEQIFVPDALAKWYTYPNRFILLAIILVVMIYLMEFSKFGFYCKSIGENERTVSAVGVNVNKIRILAFVLAGLMAGIVGILSIAKVGGSTSTLCNFMEMKIQMAIFLGGILVTGGFTAKMYKVIIGSLTIVLIQNGLTLSRVDSVVSEAIQGVLLILVLFLTIYFNRKKIMQDESKDELESIQAEQA